jgi:2,3-bisphosphoglycerate-dependent phosphoglycerate mutase
VCASSPRASEIADPAQWQSRRAARAPRVIALLGLALLLSSGADLRVSAQRPATLRIYLARHGQTDWNVERRMQGGTDIPLNATGRRQAVMLAERLKGITLDAVYSSTLSRSRETADTARGQVPLTSVAGLCERRMGSFEGRRVDDSDPVAAAQYAKRSVDPDDTLDGGESLNQFFERVRSAIDAIVARHDSGTILIVAHGGTNRMILRALVALTAEQANAIDQANDELYLIEIDPSSAPRLWKLITKDNLKDL